MSVLASMRGTFIALQTQQDGPKEKAHFIPRKWDFAAKACRLQGVRASPARHCAKAVMALPPLTFLNSLLGRSNCFATLSCQFVA